ncbi:MAG TPA: OmpA family protein [Polyangiaceae bacterium]|nr:OmpA family protein [Polyangiaceae bacterium]
MNQRAFTAVATSALLALAACGSDEKRANSPPTPPAAAPAPQAEPPAQPQPTVTRVTVTGVWLDPTIATACGIQPPKAFFEYDSAGVQRADQETLDAVARCLKSGPLKGRALQVVGHADPRGPDEYNKQLGKTRADSVAEYLTNQGVERGKLNVDSRGEQMATGTDEHGWSYDRRVDIRLAK